MMETIGEFILGIIILVLTVVIFMGIMRNTRTISLNGPVGFLQSWMSSLIFSIIIATIIGGLLAMFVTWGYHLIVAHWKVFLGIGVVVIALIGYGAKGSKKEEDNEQGPQE